MNDIIQWSVFAAGVQFGLAIAFFGVMVLSGAACFALMEAGFFGDDELESKPHLWRVK